MILTIPPYNAIYCFPKHRQNQVKSVVLTAKDKRAAFIVFLIAKLIEIKKHLSKLTHKFICPIGDIIDIVHVFF